MLSKKIVAFSTGIVLSLSAAAQAFALSPMTVEKQVSNNADGSIKVDLTYDYSDISATSKIGATAVAAVYDETGVLKEVKTENLTPSSTSSAFSVNVAKTPGYKVKTFLWKSSNSTPLALVSEFSEEELAADLPIEEKVVYAWDFEDGTGVAAVHDYSTENDPMNWTFGTAFWDNGQKFYESAYPVIKNVSEATAVTMPDVAEWVVDSDYAKRGGTEYAAPGSSKCMEFTVNSEQWGQNIAAIRVLLSKNQLQPGKKYKISMYTKNSVGTRAIYSTLKAPWTPYYNTGDNYFNDSTQTANIPWAHYKSASPVAYSNCYWTPYEFVVEPKDEDFTSDGYTNLWLAYTREFNADQMSPGGVSSGGVPYFMDKFWIDDIKITEYNDTYPLEWNFENAGNNIGEGSELGKWVSATSHYTDTAATSRMLPIEQSALISGTADAASTGPAANSTKCLKLSTGDQWCEKLSIKMKVSKDQLVPGKTYNLGMYAVAEASHQWANPYNSVYASLQPVTTVKSLGLYHEKNDQILPWVFTGRDASNWMATGRLNGFGVVRPYWYKVNTTLTPQESDFDKNGYAYLWLTFTHSDFYSKEGEDKKITPNHDIYLDDISITEVVTSGEEAAVSANN